MSRPTHSFRNLAGAISAARRVAVALTVAAPLVACGPDEYGKYQLGPDDPALKVTEADFKTVNEVIDARAKEDIAKGARLPQPGPPVTLASAGGASSGSAPAGTDALYESTESKGYGDAPADPTGASPAAAPGASGGVRFGPILATLPEGWRQVPPASSMRVAELRIAAEPGDPEEGSLAVFYFGPDAGGVQANLDRWIGQFSLPDGSPASSAARTIQMQVAGMEVSLLQLKGTMAASQMPGAPATPERPDWQLLGVIAMSPEGPYFFKATGPARTMDANYDDMMRFITSFQLAGAAPAVAAAPPVAAAPVAAPVAAAPPVAEATETSPAGSAPAESAPVAEIAAAPAEPAPATEAAPGAATAPAPAAPAPAPSAPAGKPMKIGEFHFLLPAGWKSVPPASSMRLADLRIAPAQGDSEPGLVSAFHFGPDAGGVQANVDRWVGQFSQPDGAASETRLAREELDAGGTKIVLVELTGTMAASQMPGAPATPERAGWMLLGAIVQTPDGPYFFKGTGPEKTMKGQRENMRRFVQSVSRDPIAAPATLSSEPAPAPPAPPAPAPAAAPPAPPMPESASPSAAAPAPAVEIEIGGLIATLPAGWKSRPPANSMRLAELSIPPSQGDSEEGLLTVFHFGPQGGTVDQNLDRWYGQFSQPDGAPSASRVIRESLRAGDMDVAFVDLSGTMLPQNMTGAPTPERTGWRLLGGIVSTPQGDYYFKATGPDRTMGENRERMADFLRALRWKR